MCNTRSLPAAPARARARTGRPASRSIRATPRSRRSKSSRANFLPGLTRFGLIADSGGAGEFRGGLGIRREYLNLADARFSIRSMKHLIPPNGCAGGGNGRRGDLWINPDTPAAKRLPTRYADY